ncbi:MAG: HYR domain-containing protein [Saprospiraceae bacterium]
MVTRPLNQVADAPPAQCFLAFDLPDLTITDNCSWLFTYDPPSGSNFNVGTMICTCTATDAGGNMASCMFNVTINDIIDPVANCPPTQTVNNDPGQCNAVVNFIIPDPTDNCPGATSTANPPSGSTFSVGTTPVTVTATDAAGNMSTCMFNVVVNDNEAPTVGNCNDFSVDLDINGQFILYNGIVNTQLMTADNCGLAANHGVTINPFLSCDDLGPNNVTFGIKDINGNETPCTVVLTVNDPINPMVTCPSNQVADAPPAQCFLAFDLPDPTITDNCSGATFTYDPPSGSNFNVGTTTVTCTATDAGGNMASCMFNVTINDVTDPVANCPTTYNVGNDPGQCAAVVNFMIPAPTDACPGATSTANPPSGSTFPLGTTPVTVTATDAAGNMSSCMFNVIVTDDEDPVANCPTNIVQNNDPGQCGAIVNFNIPAPLDNCPLVNTSANPASGSFFDVGTTTVTVTATDNFTNFSTCTFTVTVNDTENPVANCPANQNVNANAAGCTAIVNYPVTSPTDNCPGATMSFMPPSGSNFPSGATTVTGTATDASGNMSPSCTFTVTVNNPVTVSCTATDETCAGGNDGTAMATPTSGTAPFSYQWDAAAGNQTTQTAISLAPGMYTCTVTDANGCQNTCTSTVGVGVGACCPSSVMISANPSGDICLGTMGVQYNAVVTDGAPTNTFAWCAYNNGTGSGTCFNGFSNNAIQNPTRNWTSSTGPKSVGVTVSQAGCPDISDLYVFNVVKPAAPTPDQDMKMFCHGDPNITVGLAGTGVNVSNTLAANERIVWELVSAPANSDLTPGFLNDDCNGPSTNLVFDGEIRIANSSKVVRVDDVSVMNNMGDPIVGDYVFRAYLKDCSLDCISAAAGPFTITVKEPFPVIACPADLTVECGSSIDPMDTGNPTTPTSSCCTVAPNITHIDASAPGMCPVVEVITRTFTVDYTDCGYTPTCNQTITIEDNTPPDIVCPSDQTIEWAVGFNTTPVGANTPQDPSIDPAITGMPMASDGCGLGEVPTNCTTIAGPVTNLNYDALGLISTNFVVNGVAPIPPTVTCVHEVCVTVHMIADIGGVNFEQSNIRDEGGNIIGRNGNSNGDCNLAGAYSTMCIPVAAYNTYAADGTLSFSIDTDGDIDNICATQTIQASVEICSACEPGLMYQDVITGPTPANCPNLWVVERTWTVVDRCGMPATCVQTFTFTDTTPPVVNTCSPDPAPIEWPVGFNTTPVGPNTPQDPSIDPSNYPNIVYSDNCAVVNVGYQDVITRPTTGTAVKPCCG